MANNGKRVFLRKSNGTQLYKWSPPETDKKAIKNNTQSNNKFFCDAKPFSQGDDWFTSYAYVLVIVDGIQHKEAYVECDYVQ